MGHTFSIGIGGAAGQGVATPGDIFAKIFSRRGLHLNAYNAYQSIIRGGHTFLTIRSGRGAGHEHGRHMDLLIPLNQDTMDRHLPCWARAAPASITQTPSSPASTPTGVQLCPLPVSTLADITPQQGRAEHAGHRRGAQHDGHRLPVARGRRSASSSSKKAESVAEENIAVARAGYDYATQNFKPFATPAAHDASTEYAVLSGNTALAMGGAAAGVKFYCAYPMSPSTGVLHWMAASTRAKPASWCARWKTRSASSTWPSARRMPACAPCAPPPAAALPSCARRSASPPWRRFPSW